MQEADSIDRNRIGNPVMYSPLLSPTYNPSDTERSIDSPTHIGANSQYKYITCVSKFFYRIYL